jgi:apolipoprotein N-acyltransferase
LKLPFLKNREVLLPELKKQRKKERMLLVLSGILLGISFPPFPFPFQLLMFIGLVPYIIAIEKKKTLAEISRATYLTFFIFSIITVYWVGSWQKGTDPFLMIAGGALLFFNPLLFLIPSTLFYITKRSFNTGFAFLAFPLFWITYEYLFMLTDISFPWLTLGSGLSHFTIFIQVADLIGAVGISVIVVYINIFIYKAYISFKEKDNNYGYYVAAFILTFSVVIYYGSYQLSNFKVSNKKVRVGLIQPNLDPWNKWELNRLDETINLYLSLSKKAVNEGAELIVWPETALPVYLMSLAYYPEKDSIYKFLKTNDVYLLTGMPDIIYYQSSDDIPPDAKYSKAGEFYYSIYNGILLLSPNTRKIERYGKMKLVPFGEKVPFTEQLPFLGRLFSWGVGISGWNVGRDTVVFNVPLKIKTGSSVENYHLKINGLVCYESVYPYFVTQFVKKGTDLITVVTNDSWYGKSSGPYQHKEIAVLRAIENRKSVIRDANGGISCIIDPLGRTLKETELFKRTELTGDVPVQEGKTFFSEYPMIIPTFASYLSLCVFIFFLILKFRKKLNPIV